jgi:aldehyde:ferredoxin oxidoreductase
MYGWTGKILKIDLTEAKTEVLRPDKEVYQKNIGGKGLAGYYLKDRITESWDSPDIPILFFTGPLVNTLSPTSGRMTIMSRSPLTGTVCDTSAGGRLGTELKKAGWDGVMITGKSRNLCGIEIADTEIRFVDAGSLKNRNINQIASGFNSNVSYAVTGPAADNGVLFANICLDRSFFAGRGGLGLVMAGKNLKFITVRGSGKTRIYNRQVLLKAREDIFRLVSASPVLKGEFGISNYGTGALYDLISERRAMPTLNFRKTYFENAGNMNSWNYKKRFGYKKAGCSGCHILCKRRDKNNQELPEFETMSHFSALINNKDIHIVKEANRLCNEAGLDTISMASTLACYMELNHKNLTGDEILQLIKDTSLSRGEGRMLKLGSARLSTNAKQASMTVKKLELPAYDPRGVYGMALAYATSTRGGCHLRAYPISHEILRKPVATDRFSFSGKARIIKISEDMNAVIDSLTACKFVFFAATLEEYAKAFYGVTGVKTTAQDLLKTGERIYYRERIMNCENGFTKEDDDLPERFFTMPGTSGDGITIKPLNRQEYLQALLNYYKVRGLTPEGMPTEKKCKELELEWKSSYKNMKKN